MTKQDCKPIVAGAAPPKPDNPMAKALAALAAIPRCGAFARSSGQPCRQPGTGANGKCRFHGGKSTGRPVTSGKHTKVHEMNIARLRILFHLLGALNPETADQRTQRWFYSPRDEDDPAKLVAKYRQLTRQVEKATQPRKKRQR
jgi:hypothetical protein